MVQDASFTSSTRGNLVHQAGFRSIAFLLTIFLVFALAPPPALAAPIEAEVGVGASLGTDGAGGAGHVLGRWKPGRSFGVGLYAGGAGPFEGQGVVPVCGRLSLSGSLGKVESTGSLGVGAYYVGDIKSPAFGFHVAWTLMFPGRRFGIESTAHVTGSSRSGSGATGFLTLEAVARLF